MAAHGETRDSGVVAAAGRLALYPARVAARASRDRIETAAEDWLTGPEGKEALDRLLGGPLPEELARLLVEHRVLERMAGELAATGALDRMTDEALQSAQVQELTHRLVRELTAAQATGFSHELADAVRSRAHGLDERLDLRDERAPGYGGVATRAIALGVDAALITVTAAVVSSMLTLIASLVGSLRPAWLVGLLLAVGWTLLATGYFAVCWSVVGQTLGMRLLHLRVRHAGAAPSLPRSLLRVGGLWLSIAVCFLGFVPVLFDSRRRGLADWVAGTTVELDPS